MAGLRGTMREILSGVKTETVQPSNGAEIRSLKSWDRKAAEIRDTINKKVRMEAQVARLEVELEDVKKELESVNEQLLELHINWLGDGVVELSLPLKQLLSEMADQSESTQILEDQCSQHTSSQY